LGIIGCTTICPSPGAPSRGSRKGSPAGAPAGRVGLFCRDSSFAAAAAESRQPRFKQWSPTCSRPRLFIPSFRLVPLARVQFWRPAHLREHSACSPSASFPCLEDALSASPQVLPPLLSLVLKTLFPRPLRCIFAAPGARLCPNFRASSAHRSMRGRFWTSMLRAVAPFLVGDQAVRSVSFFPSVVCLQTEAFACILSIENVLRVLFFWWFGWRSDKARGAVPCKGSKRH
jgi:hypothetical protein